MSALVITRWKPSGYPTVSAYAGSWFCRFRLCHVRDDGLEVLTLGHQVEKGGRLAAIMPGFHFLTWVLMPGQRDGDDTQEIERAACNDAMTATAQHMALLAKYEAEGSR